MNRETCVPVIDLFAGPGGLGEGFSSFKSDSPPFHPFKIALSVEENSDAHRTLLLRSFFRQFTHEKVPEIYYEVLNGRIALDELPGLIQLEEPEEVKIKWNRAKSEARKATIGDPLCDTNINAWIKRKLSNSTDRWVLVGGPPCQAYSVVGRARNQAIKGYSFEDDARRDLYRHYLRVISQHWPSIFVMENVKGLLSSKYQGDLLIRKILSDLQDPAAALEFKNIDRRHRYRVYSIATDTVSSSDLTVESSHSDFVVRCENHGIPQERHRVILLGVRDNISSIPRPLEKQKRIPLKHVLNGLPRLRSGLSRSRKNGKYLQLKDSTELWLSYIKEGVGSDKNRKQLLQGISAVAGKDVADHLVSVVDKLRAPSADRGGQFVSCDPDLDNKDPFYDWFIDERLGGVCNHETRTHLDKDLLRYLYASSFAKVKGLSPKLSDFPINLQPMHKNRTSGIFVDRFRVQLSDHPSTTVTSHISRDGHYYIHPDPSQCRSLTVREAARLQTFPDNYFFSGGRTAQYAQVGNAVPPLLARQIAAIAWELISAE